NLELLHLSNIPICMLRISWSFHTPHVIVGQYWWRPGGCMKPNSRSQGHGVAAAPMVSARVSSGGQKPFDQGEQNSGMVTRNPAPDSSPPSVSSDSQTLTIKSC